MPIRARYLLIFLLLAGALLWAALRLVGWPLWNGRSPYHLVPDWPKLPPGVALGQVAGVGVNSQGQVFVFSRGAKVWESETIDASVIDTPTVHVFDGQTGDLLNTWGANSFVMPHGLTVGRDGTLWLTDVGLHQVFHYDATGNLLLVLGEAGVPGLDATHFNRPTDVALAPDGSFYVSDGYINSRIVHFDQNGRYLQEWGSPGTDTGMFDVPHSLAVDAQGRVYVADRGNARLQIFGANGRFLESWQNIVEIGRPWAVRLDDAGNIYLVDGGDQNQWLPDRARILKLTADGEIVERFGGYGRQPGHFVWPHALAIGPDGAVYVGEVGGGQRIQKFTFGGNP